MRLPFNPCGMVMDTIRSAYRTKIRPFRDSDEEVEIRWFFAAPEAKDFPGEHRFTSGNWELDKPSWNGPGEVKGASRPWSNGERPPQLNGQHFCGKLEDFQRGALSTAAPLKNAQRGVSLCCDRKIVGRGQLRAGGGAIRPGMAPGGVHVGGQVIAGESASGGVLVGGRSAEGRSAAGGVLVGGRSAAGVPVSGGALAGGRSVGGRSAAGGVLAKGRAAEGRPVSGGALAGGRSAEGLPVSGGALAGGGLVPPNICANCPDGAYVVYKITLSGTGDGTCDCSGVDGEYLVRYFSPCRWIGSAVAFGACIGTRRFELIKGPLDMAVRLWNGTPTGIIALWEAPTEDWDCLTPFVVNNTFTGSRCDFSASTVTIEPLPYP